MRFLTRKVASPQVSTSSDSGIDRHRRRNCWNVTRRSIASLVIIPAIDEEARQRARERQDRLTKPAGSLGRLELLSIDLAGMTGRIDTPLEHRVVFTLAADHGVATEGVSAYPSEVTAQMVLNFLRGGAAINVLARLFGARVVVADLGVAADLPPHPDLRDRKVRRGAGNIARGPAMTVEDAAAAVAAGRGLVA